MLQDNNIISSKSKEFLGTLMITANRYLLNFLPEAVPILLDKHTLNKSLLER